MIRRSTLTLLLAFTLVVAACGDDDALTTQAPTTNPPATTATTAAPPPPSTTTTAAPAPTTTVTTSAPTTTVTTLAPTTTTTVPFNGTIDSKSGDFAGNPGGLLIDVRTGKHSGFTRVVWELDGATGAPWYQIGYADPPFANVADDQIPVNGNAFIRVVFSPGNRYDLTDPNNIFLVYQGSEAITVNQGSVVQVVFIDDFEATMEWVVGLSAQKPFHVFTLENPVRLVVDIAD